MTAEQITLASLVATGALTFLHNWQASRNVEAALKAKAEEEERHRKWDLEDRASKQEELLNKIDANTADINTTSKTLIAENTELSVKAFEASAKAVDASNHISEKIVTVAQDAHIDAVISRENLAKVVSDMSVTVEAIRLKQVEMIGNVSEFKAIATSISDLAKELTAVRATAEETRRLVQVRLGDVRATA